MYVMKIMDPMGGANFDLRTIIWTLFVEIFYTMFHTLYLTSSFCQTEMLISLTFVLYTYTGNQWPLGQGQFWPQGYNLNTFVKFHSMMFNTKYLSSRPYTVRNDFIKLLLRKYKARGQFDPRAIIWTIFGEF
jgi:hypothetical protein